MAVFVQFSKFVLTLTCLKFSTWAEPRTLNPPVLSKGLIFHRPSFRVYLLVFLVLHCKKQKVQLLATDYLSVYAVYNCVSVCVYCYLRIFRPCCVWSGRGWAGSAPAARWRWWVRSTNPEWRTGWASQTALRNRERQGEHQDTGLHAALGLR